MITLYKSLRNKRQSDNEKTGMEKLEITAKTLIGGIDIAKKVHWARFVDYRGISLGKAVRFENNKVGLNTL